MSSFSYQNSALPTPTILKYELLSLKAGATAIAPVANGTVAPTVVSPIRNLADSSTLSLFLPVGVYAVQMLSAVTAGADNQPIPICQQLLVNASTNAVLASGRTIGTTTLTNTAYGDTIILSDSVFVNITIGQYVTLSLIASFVGATPGSVLAPGLFGPADNQTNVTPRITAYKMV